MLVSRLGFIFRYSGENSPDVSYSGNHSNQATIRFQCSQGEEFLTGLTAHLYVCVETMYLL